MPVTTDGKMTAPLGVKAVANYFGVATDTFSACTAGAINKWAKHKPIALASMGLADTPASLTAAQKKAANYGLTYKTAYATSKAYLPEKIAEVCGENGTWTYTKPVEGTDWARLDDFLNPDEWEKGKTIVGYDAECEGMCVNFDLGNTEYRTNVLANTLLSFSVRSASSYPGQLHLNELAYYDSKLKDCYLCLAFKYGAEWYYIFSTGTVDSITNWDDSDPAIELPVITNSIFEPFTKIPKNTKTSFTGRLCLIDLIEAFGSDANIPSTYKGGCVSQTSLAAHAYNVYSLPFADMSLSQQQFYVTNPAAATQLSVNASWDYVTGGIQITVTVANHMTVPRAFDNLFVYFMTETVVDDSNLDEHTEAAIYEWESGTKHENGITVDGKLCAAYRSVSLGGATLAVGEEKTYTVFLPEAAYPYGNINEYALIWMCYAEGGSIGRVVSHT